MKQNNIILFAIGAGLLYFLVRKGQSALSTTFSLEKLGIDLKNKKIKITMGANNPTGASTSLNSLVGSLYIAGKQVASVESFNKIEILPNAKSLITLDLRPTLAGIFQTLKEIIKSKGKTAASLQATFEGTANVDGVSLPVKTILG